MVTVTPVAQVEVQAAAMRIAGHVRITPVLDVEPGTFGRSGCTLKLELFQHAGSFKPRGAFNRVLGERGPAPGGLVAASGGNHGVATAHVARSLGLSATVFVPSVSPAAKRDRIAALGAEVVVAGDIYDDAQAAADERARATGALLVHPYDHPSTVAGAGTVARELEAQAPALDTVLVAVGGGGLIAGVASWYRGRVKVVSVEPEGIPAMQRAIAAGEPVEVPVGGFASDSLGAKRIGAVPWACAAPFVHEAVLVSDDAIRATQRLLWQACRIIAEPGGAAALAALVDGVYEPAPGERVGVIVCGANTDPATIV
jgi:threonine dehydratase